MSRDAEPVSMTVYRKPDGTWWVRLWDDSFRIMGEWPIRWNGDGSFQQEGLNHVVRFLPEGYACANWEYADDGSYTALLYRRYPGF
ncbi:hypothetical protein [Sinomonas mesophila]|uniref:hypothetical protein n=1 Tax=Sinomonas mesophila TaxID=1531955 RepID=UPI000987785E|nr:hypothetical protein [Sinomonas mesophila]